MPCENAEHELFMYSVLTQRPEMTKIFMKEGIVKSNILFLRCTQVKIRVKSDFLTFYDKI